jgi:hypothetical protein
MDAPIMYSEQGLEATKQGPIKPVRSELMDAPAMYSEEGLEATKQSVSGSMLEQPAETLPSFLGGHRRRTDGL